MASEIKLPELGENLEGGEVLDVRVAEGDTVAEGQTLIEVEAEKSTVEVPSPQAGRITRLLVKKGEQVHVGQGLALIEGGAPGEPAGPKKAPAAKVATPPSEPEPKQTARRSGGEEPTEREEAAVEEKVEETGRGKRPEGDGTADGNGRRAPARPEGELKRGAVAPHAGKLVPAGPATRRLARELGVDLCRVSGSAPGGRVTQEDVKDFVRRLAAAPAGPGAVSTRPLPDFERWGPVERQALEPVRRRTAEQMSLAWALVPHVTQHDEADITDLDAFRRRQEGKGPKLTVTAFALKAVANALQEFPRFNASLDTSAGQLILKRYYHIGVAVDTDRGLLVPVLRDVDQKGVRALAAELADAAERARQKKLPVEEMRGGTFTITNLGGIGGAGFSPIVNYPEVAILGMSRARMQPVVRDGQVVPRLILPLSLSYDHRVIDGADAARFARRVAEMLEDPRLMLL